jgi:hypothetical protein
MNLYPAAALVDGEAAALDNAMPGDQNAKVGSRIQLLEQRAIYVQKVTISADAHGSAGKVFTAEVSGELMGVMLVATAASASGTVQLRRSTTAITDAVIAAVADTYGVALTIVQAQKAIVQGESLNLLTHAAADRAVVYLMILRS